MFVCCDAENPFNFNIIKAIVISYRPKDPEIKFKLHFIYKK